MRSISGRGEPKGHEVNTYTLHGIPCSPGTVTGSVALYARDRQDRVSTQGDTIWVVDGPLDVGIVMEAIGLALAIVARDGGRTCHGANIAREAGLPTVSGIGGAIERLKHARRCRVDGATGHIEVQSDD